MGFITFFKNMLRFGSGGFNDFEQIVLRQIMSTLPKQEQMKFEQRVNSINLVQRLDGGREINCYELKNGRPELQEATRINDVSGEIALAKVVVNGAQGTANTGTVWLVDGNFFSLEFDNPTEHADANKIYSVQVDLI